MKKLSALIIALMTVCFANAASTLYFGELKIKPGDTQTIELNLQNEARLKGLELVLTLPTGLSFVYDAEEEEYVVGERCGWLSSNLRANGALKIAGAATKTKDYVAVGDGALFSVKVKADQNATLGTGNITISEVEIVTEASTENPDASQFPIKIYQEFTVTASSASETMGSVTGSGSYESGTNATLTATANTGYEFEKWSNDVTDNPYTFTVNSDVTLTGMFKATTYTITYNPGDGATFSTDKNSYTIETETFTLDEPTKTGYDFKGWYDNAEFTGEAVTQIAKGSKGDKTLYAKWEAITYNITYTLNGGDNDPANPATYTVETETITLAAPSRNGYDFGGWYNNAEFAGEAVTEIAKGSTGHKTLFAKWNIITYDINYELNGGTNHADNPATYNIETETITLKDPTRTGYDFKGWYDNAEFTGDAVTQIAKGSTGDKTFYAKWEVITYNITYTLNGGDNDPGNLTTYTIETETFGLGNATRDGYTFDGWYDNAEFSGEAVTVITKGSTGDKTFFAKWTAITYNINYDANGGILADGNPNTYTIETPDFKLNNPTRDAYDFAGWTGTDLTEPTIELTIQKGSMGDRAYMATWTPVTYKIEYDLAGGEMESGVTNPAEFTVETPNFTLNNPVRTGYTFAGWTGGDLTEATTKVTIAQGSTGDRKYTATWDVNQYTMTFVFGGNGQENQEITQDFGTALTAPTPNAWTGHTFKGWNPEVPATIPAENKTFTAQWDVNKYKLTFMVGESVYKQYELEYGAATTTPENPTKEGYTFTGWDAEIPATMPANDVTINAQFSINQYTMTFKFGESGQTDVVIKDDYGKALTAPTPDEWTGHTFKAWSPEVPVTIPAQDMTFNAVWDVAKYKLTFMVDGQVYKQEEVPYGAQITVPTDPTKEGYTFTGWDAEIPATMPANDLTFNAQFSINQYTMTFKFGESGQTDVTIKDDFGKTLTAPTPEEWTGHTFKGWSPEVPATIPAQDMIFTAQWDVNKYKLTFMVDDQVYKQEEVAYGAQISAPTDPTKEGHTFTGWDAEIPATMPASDLTFNAQFSINQYDVIYMVKGVEWNRDRLDYGATIVLREYTPEEGEQFNGWVSDQEYITMPAHDVTYTANITPATGIANIMRDGEKVNVYTLTGVLVGRQMSASEVLKLEEGLYIINGKKVAIGK